jgi:hypothetical protein
MKKLIPSAIVALCLAACGPMQPDDRCTINDKPRCIDDSTAVVCSVRAGIAMRVRCPGPMGCAQRIDRVTCDSRVALAGTNCSLTVNEAISACSLTSSNGRVICETEIWKELSPCPDKCSIDASGGATCF